MYKVVEMLEGPLQSVSCPPKPVMSSPTRPPELIKTYGTATPARFNYAEVKQMTNSFQKKLGQGVYGIAFIYEFMPNSSLDKFTYKQGSSRLISNLDRGTLYQITISIA
ncbi:hypothetical protein Ahy_B01g051911 [Arachis hypogaea]|uniref:Uncharacterized protein n=1 Tax=Arachis hypogaea TaxID=3818 RepID=A0A445AN51_ARAHY|nr:hypothetical protein Ahy_B01g051911 [Arachis hypogaea]